MYKHIYIYIYTQTDRQKHQQTPLETMYHIVKLTLRVYRNVSTHEKGLREARSGTL